MKVGVIGLGYVGLSTGIALSSLGHSVRAFDIDVGRAQLLSAGKVPIYEPGLETALTTVLENGRFRLASSLQGAVSDSDVVMVAVGTPSGVDGEPDLTALVHVADDLAAELRDDHLVVLKSTVPPGTDLAFSERVATRRRLLGLPEVNLVIGVNPEFLREGHALEDSLHPSRIVIGLADASSRSRLSSLYGVFDCPIVWTDPTSAALIKYASNCFLATRISFINEMARLCTLSGASIDDVERGMGADPRIGSRYLSAGIGYGGSCLPKDTMALLSIGRRLGYCPRIVQATVDVNADQVTLLIREIERRCAPGLVGLRVAVLGAAFKADTDDIRDSVGIRLANELARRGAVVSVHDYRALTNAQTVLRPDMRLSATVEEAVSGADVVAVATEWANYEGLDWEYLATLMEGRLVLDGRNVLDPEAVRRAGLEYWGIGRPAEGLEHKGRTRHVD